MKRHEITEVHKNPSDTELFESIMLESSLHRELAELDEMDAAYEQLNRLAMALRTGNFGWLIDRPGGKLSERDINDIKREIYTILHTNPIIVGSGMGASRSGKTRLSLLGRTVAHGLETVSLGILAGVLGGLTVTTALSGFASWVSGLAGFGAVLTGRMAGNQAKDFQSVLAAGKLINIVDSYKNIGKVRGKRIERGWIRRFVDWVEGKSPKQIKRETEKRVQRAVIDTRREFEESIRKLPREIEFFDRNGNRASVPVEFLFGDV